MSTEDEAKAAIEKVNKSKIGEYELTVNEARPRPERTGVGSGGGRSSGGGFGGGFGGGGFGGGRGNGGGYGKAAIAVDPAVAVVVMAAVVVADTAAATGTKPSSQKFFKTVKKALAKTIWRGLFYVRKRG